MLSTLIQTYIELNESEEYKKAKKIVGKQDKLKEHIKKMMKDQNINETTIVSKNGKIIDFGFKIRYINQLDLINIPKDIKDKYTIPKEYWYLEYKYKS